MENDDDLQAQELEVKQVRVHNQYGESDESYSNYFYFNLKSFNKDYPAPM